MLGSLQASRAGETVPIASGRQQALLVNLLIAAGRSVSNDTLIEAIWGEDTPSNPANTLQHTVAQLRKVLEPESPAWRGTTGLDLRRRRIPAGSLELSVGLC